MSLKLCPLLHMKDDEYIQRVATMLYHYRVHEILADNNTEHFQRLSKLPQSKRYRGVYQIFIGGSEAKSPRTVLGIVKLQLGIYPGDDNFDFLLDFDKEKILSWFVERHQKYKFLNCGVYGIICNTTHDTYIGSSQNIERRLANHRCRLNAFTHLNATLQALWVKYGEANFDLKPLKITVDYKNYEKIMIEKWREHMPLINSREQRNRRIGFGDFGV